MIIDIDECSCQRLIPSSNFFEALKDASLLAMKCEELGTVFHANISTSQCVRRLEFTVRNREPLYLEVKVL